MKKILLIFLYSLFILDCSWGQNIGINATGVAPNVSAMLDVESTDKGVLIPRVNIADLTTAAPVTTPATSLLVYNTNTTTGEGYYYWDATKWVKLLDGNTTADHDWYEVGTTTAPNNITDNIFTQGKVGIGVASPVAVLDVVGDLAINRNEITGGFRSWMVDGVRVGAGGSDNAYFGLKDEGVNNADAVVAWGDDAGDHLRFINTRSGGPVDGVEYVRITDVGNVGINTTTPTEKLQVNGSIKIVDGTQGARKILTSDANGKATWQAGAVQEASNGTYKRICSGSTAPGVGWVDYTTTNGIYIDVNTSGCNFTNTPRYVTSLGGASGHWLTTGVTSIYQPTATGFRIYLAGMSHDGNPWNLRVSNPETNQYYINWIAIGD